jgi:predicted transcriptional regulator
MAKLQASEKPPKTNIFQMSALPELLGGEPTDILQCLYGLNSLEIDLFKILLDHPGKTSVKDLATAVNKNRSTVQRALSRLKDLDLVVREQDVPEATNENLKGGYCYKYGLQDAKVIEINMKTRISQWTERADQLITQVSDRFEGFEL